MHADRDDQWAMARPGSILRGFDSISGFRLVTEGHVQQVEFPHSAVTLLFQYGAPVSVNPTGAGSDSLSVAVGLASRPVGTEMSGQIDCIEVRLTPPAAYEIFGGVPMSELADQAIATADLVKSGIDQLVGQCPPAQSWAERFETTARTLTSAQHQQRPADAEVWEAWRLLQATSGQVTVTELCRRTGWTAKRLRSRFLQQVGTTPKRAARLIRFENTHNRLQRSSDLVRVAAECGFVDQSHMHREVKAFTGLTLNELANSAGQGVFVQDSDNDEGSC